MRNSRTSTLQPHQTSSFEFITRDRLREVFGKQNPKTNLYHLHFMLILLQINYNSILSHESTVFSHGSTIMPHRDRKL